MKFIFNVPDLLSLRNEPLLWDFIVNFLLGSNITVDFPPFLTK